MHQQKHSFCQTRGKASFYIPIVLIHILTSHLNLMDGYEVVELK